MAARRVPAGRGGGDPAAVAGFVRWARAAAQDFAPDRAPIASTFAPLGAMIGDAEIIALGEAEHLLDEPLALRNLLLRYLVEEKGVTAIAIESGLVEGRVLHDFVLSGGGDVEAACRRGLSWTFDRLARNLELIRWITDHNQACGAGRKLRFYGFDISGSPSVPAARCGVDLALAEALRFAVMLDPPAAAPLEERHTRFAGRLRFNLARPGAPPGYESLSLGGRDDLSALVGDLIAFIAARAPVAPDDGSGLDHRWGLRTAIAAGQVDAWLRGVPSEYDGAPEQLRFLQRNADLRDQVQADNIDWILRQEGEGGRLLVFAHNNHLAMTSSRWLWSPIAAGRVRRGDMSVYRRRPAGTHLKARYGARLATIAHVTSCHRPGRNQPEPAPDSTEWLLGQVGKPSFLLDLRQRPASLAAFLAEPRRLGAAHRLNEKYLVELEIALEGAFDILHYNQASSAAQGSEG